MSAPAGTAPAGAAPAAAAPIGAAAPAEPAAAAPAGGVMGPMVPPMMGGPRGGGGDQHAKQLYSERKLRVEAPPNSEPVKGRREGRDAARGTDRKVP